MTPPQVFTIVVSVLNLGLALVVYLNNRRNTVNVSFFIFTLAITFWGVTYIVAQQTGLLFWGRMVFFFGLLMGFGFILFSSSFPKRIRKLNNYEQSFLWLPFLVLLALLFFTPLILRGYVVHADNLEPQLGSAYILLILYVIVAVVYGIVRLLLRYKKSFGIERLQFKYLLFGLIIFSLFAVTTNVILPIVGVYQLNALGPIFSVFLVAAVTYAMVRHRLMDIRIVLKKTLLHVAVSLVMLAFILGAIFTVAHFLMKRIPAYSLVFTGSIAMVIALLFLNPLNRFFERIANRYFFTSLYNYQATLEELAQGLTAVIEIHKVIDLIVGTIMRAMGLDRAGVLLLSPEKNSKRYIIAKVIGFNEQNGISLVRDNFLVQWLSQNRKMIIFEELQRLIEESSIADERSKLMRLKTNMNKIEASLCIPLFSKDTLISIIVLGSKVTRDPYTSEDLRLLQTIANQASISVQNARLYAQIQDFSLTLQEKVHEQTRDIKEKNERLQELLKMKSEFLSIASHQLRTPLTAIRGLLSMQADGDFDTYPQEKIHEQQKHMLESANRLSNIVNDLLDAMELEGGNLKFQFKNIRLEDMIKEICSDLQPNYDRKGLYLKVEKSKNPIPQIEIEPKMFHEALENLIDNAEKYTNKGGTTITLSADTSNATIIVRDTGIGIPKSDFPKLFQKFSRGEKSSYQHTDGSGLGLFIAKNVFTEHHGKIEVTSPGEGKGTTVTITIPLKQPQTQKQA